MKTVLITGANKGLGFEIASELSKGGFHVILTARDEKKGQEAFQKIEKSGKVSFHVLDITREDSIATFLKWFSTQSESLDVLVNNAGILKTNGPLVATADEIREQMETNFLGPYNLTQKLLPFLKKSAEGKIINVSTQMAVINSLGTGYAGYRLSKVALNGWTILLSNELADTNIKVNAVCPGWVKTDMGGKNAPLSPAEGADTVIWLIEKTQIPTGKFWHKRKTISW